MNPISFTIKSRTTQIRHASPNPLFLQTLHIQLPKASPSSCSFPVTPPQSISTQAKVHHQQSLPWLLQFQSRGDGTSSRTWTFAPSSSPCKGIGKRQRLFLSWQARAGLPFLRLGAQGWLEAEEKRSPSPGRTQMETLHNLHFLTPVETGWPLPRNHTSGQRGFPQEPTNKPEKKKKKGWSMQKAPRGSRLAWRRQRWSLRYLHRIIFSWLQRQQRFSSLSSLMMPCPSLLPNWIQPPAQLFLPCATSFLSPKSLQVSTLRNWELNDFPQASQADLTHQHKTYNLQVVFPILWWNIDFWTRKEKRQKPTWILRHPNESASETYRLIKHFLRHLRWML